MRSDLLSWTACLAAFVQRQLPSNYACRAGTRLDLLQGCSVGLAFASVAGFVGKRLALVWSCSRDAVLVEHASLCCLDLSKARSR